MHLCSLESDTLPFFYNCHAFVDRSIYTLQAGIHDLHQPVDGLVWVVQVITRSSRCVLLALVFNKVLLQSSVRAARMYKIQALRR